MLIYIIYCLWSERTCIYKVKEESQTIDGCYINHMTFLMDQLFKADGMIWALLPLTSNGGRELDSEEQACQMAFRTTERSRREIYPILDSPAKFIRWWVS